MTSVHITWIAIKVNAANVETQKKIPYFIVYCFVIVFHFIEHGDKFILVLWKLLWSKTHLSLFTPLRISVVQYHRGLLGLLEEYVYLLIVSVRC